MKEHKKLTYNDIDQSFEISNLCCCFLNRGHPFDVAQSGFSLVNMLMRDNRVIYPDNLQLTNAESATLKLFFRTFKEIKVLVYDSSMLFLMLSNHIIRKNVFEIW